ncbi:MAG: TetR/AcrR family transcriptional regulator [Oscillospiraceae bacterium]
MSRNKYPEVTVARILDVSEQLFLEKGYEHTTIQDIINALGDLSKGAIYHHFKSKEEIIIAVVDRLYVGTQDGCAEIQADKSLNGLEKLRKLFYLSIGNPNHKVAFETMPNFFENPKFLAMQLEQTIYELAHKIIEPIICEGVADGSIQTQYPKELAEVVSLLSNIWLNPMLFHCTKQEIYNKCMFLKTLMKSLGVDAFDDELTEMLEQIACLANNDS